MDLVFKRKLGQKKGVAMGTKSAPSFANMFMGHFEKSLFTTKSGSKGLLSHGGDTQMKSSCPGKDQIKKRRFFEPLK